MNHLEVWEAELASESDTSMAKWLLFLRRIETRLDIDDRLMDGFLLAFASDCFDAGMTSAQVVQRLLPTNEVFSVIGYPRTAARAELRAIS